VVEKSAEANLVSATLICLENHLATYYANQGLYEEAETILKQAVVKSHQTSLGTHPQIAESLQSLAILYSHQGRYADAEPLLKGAVGIMEEVVGTRHPNTQSSIIDLVMVLAKQKKLVEARDTIERYHEALTPFLKQMGGV
jgi:tetratricopeptide (TPR) repeat protein